MRDQSGLFDLFNLSLCMEVKYMDMINNTNHLILQFNLCLYCTAALLWVAWDFTPFTGFP